MECEVNDHAVLILARGYWGSVLRNHALRRIVECIDSSKWIGRQLTHERAFDSLIGLVEQELCRSVNALKPFDVEPLNEWHELRLSLARPDPLAPSEHVRYYAKVALDQALVSFFDCDVRKPDKWGRRRCVRLRQVTPDQVASSLINHLHEALARATQAFAMEGEFA